jgi:mannitol-specific phosphotransferase system IIBC component
MYSFTMTRSGEYGEVPLENNLAVVISLAASWMLLALSTMAMEREVGEETRVSHENRLEEANWSTKRSVSAREASSRCEAEI